MTKNIFLLSIIVPLLLMGAGCVSKSSLNTTADSNATSSDSALTGSTTDATDDMAISAVVEPGVEVVKIKTGTSTVQTKNYMATLKIYGENGYRFQFSNCSGNPGSLNIKRGAKFMIDNRDGESHKIVIGTKIYQLAGYDFALVSIQKAGSYIITCDGGGSAHVGVQN